MIIVRLTHPRSGDSQGQEMFLTHSADNQTYKYDKECYIYVFFIFCISSKITDVSRKIIFTREISQNVLSRNTETYRIR